jgi:hypothetical protein
VRGFDPNLAETLAFVPKTYSDLMTYDADKWMSPRTWRRMLGSQCNSSSAECGSKVSPVRVRQSGRRVVADNAAPRQVAYGLVIKGVTTILGVTQMPAWYAQTLASGSSSGTITVRSSAGRVLGSAPIVGGGDPDSGSTVTPFFADLPNVSGIASIKATSPAGKVIGTLAASTHAPAVRFVSVPARASAAKSVTVAYSATDSDKQGVSVLIWARRGAGVWKLVAVGSPSGKASVVPKALGAKGGLQFKITATDGLRSTTVLSKAIPVV